MNNNTKFQWIDNDTDVSEILKKCPKHIHKMIEEMEQADLEDAIDELVDLLETAKTAFDAVKQNFTTRQFNKYILALEEMANEVKGLKDD